MKQPLIQLLIIWNHHIQLVLFFNEDRYSFTHVCVKLLCHSIRVTRMWLNKILLLLKRCGKFWASQIVFLYKQYEFEIFIIVGGVHR